MATRRARRGDAGLRGRRHDRLLDPVRSATVPPGGRDAGTGSHEDGRDPAPRALGGGGDQRGVLRRRSALARPAHRGRQDRGPAAARRRLGRPRRPARPRGHRPFPRFQAGCADRGRDPGGPAAGGGRPAATPQAAVRAPQRGRRRSRRAHAHARRRARVRSTPGGWRRGSPASASTPRCSSTAGPRPRSRPPPGRSGWTWRASTECPTPSSSARAERRSDRASRCWPRARRGRRASSSAGGAPAADGALRSDRAPSRAAGTG